jgi:hypothetical protein
MADLNYKDLGLKRLIMKDTFKWGDKNIEVLKYLPVEAKYDIVMITLQKAQEEGYYNPIKLDMYFHLNLVYMYTNLVFTEEERQDEGKLFDEMKSSGFLNTFLQYIDKEEYEEMLEDIDNIAELSMKYRMSAGAVFNKFVDDLPANAEAAQKIVDSFEPEKYQAVVDFAKAANGGREIK